jgi:L-fuculose-phosphate aldolase
LPDSIIFPKEAAVAEPKMELVVVGWVRSELTSLRECPMQNVEGAPPADVEIKPEYADAAADLQEGQEIYLFTWLHESSRDVLKVRPRGDPARPITGVFSTRSPARPNPVGIHHVRILQREGLRLRVDRLEVLDGTPVVDIKSVSGGRRT